MSDPIHELSPGGSARKERILEFALQAARQRRHRRITRNGIAAAIALLIGIAVWRMVPQKPMAKENIVVIKHSDRSKPTAAPAANSTVVWVQTDPKILKRMEELGHHTILHWIGDDELLKSLAEMNRPAGLLQFDGKAIVMLRD
jgi:hypothetical protein